MELALLTVHKDTPRRFFSSPPTSVGGYCPVPMVGVVALFYALLIIVLRERRSFDRYQALMGPVEKHQFSPAARFMKPGNDANREPENWTFSTGPMSTWDVLGVRHRQPSFPPTAASDGNIEGDGVGTILSGHVELAHRICSTPLAGSRRPRSVGPSLAMPV